MAFGQQSGPPATARQLSELLDLLIEAGHSDFRDARGPLGFTQRQAGGKFTHDEADTFIAQLQDEAEAERVAGDAGTPAPAEPPAASRAPASRPPASRAPASRPPTARPKGAVSSRQQPLDEVPTEQLAAELQRRGWVVMEP